MQRKLTSASNWETVRELNAKGTSYSNTSENAGTNYDLTKAYDIRLVVSDKVGQSISMASISTSSTVMSWSDKGVGIGKIVENGRILDVAGDVYVDGDIYKNGMPIGGAQKIPPNSDLNTYTTTGNYYNHNAADAKTITNTATDRAFILEVADTDKRIIYQTFTDFIGRKYYRRYYHIEGTWDDWRKVMTESDFTSGSNANGNWARFPDGTQIVYSTIVVTYNSRWMTHKNWAFPIAFKDSPIVTANVSNGGATGLITTVDSSITSTTRTRVMVTIKDQAMENFDSSTEHKVGVIAIGRWK
ncbi:MAG: pyocin knob domain-containing protein [Aerococcus suis]|nr:pyocin knob domain-containing protein [Aerococcus suis]